MRPRDRDVLLLACIVALAFVLRLTCVRVLAPATSGIADPFYFQQVSRLLATGHGLVRPWEAVFSGQTLPTAEHPPLYVFVLAAAWAIGMSDDGAQRSLGAVFGAVTVVLLAAIGRRIGGRRLGLLCALLAATYPQLLGADSALMSETLYTPMIAGVLLLAYRATEQPTVRRAAALGALIGIATLTRSDAAPLALLLLPPIVARAERQRAQVAVMIPLAAFLVVSPWLVRNHVVFDRFVLSNNKGGFLALSNCPSTYAGRLLGGTDAACLGPRVGANEAEVDANWQRQGLRFAREHITRAPVVAVFRVLRMWGLWHPLQASGDELEGRGTVLNRLGLIAFYLLLPLSMLGAVRLRHEPPHLAVLLAPVVLVTAVAALTAGAVRYRHAAEPSIVVLAAVGAAALFDQWRRHGHRAAA